MKEEEMLKTMRSFTQKQLLELSADERKVFYAMMNIADERDELQSVIDTAVDYLENNLKSFLYSVEYKTLLNILKGFSYGKTMEEELNSRISETADKQLLIFYNRKELEEYKKRNGTKQNIIYKTQEEIENCGLTGLRYTDWAMCSGDE